MTARELADACGRLGITIGVEGGKPIPRARWTEHSRREWQRMLPHIGKVRTAFLAVMGCNLWDKDWCIQRMQDADAVVEHCGAVGLDAEIQSAALEVVACFREHDRAGLDAWCGRVEDRARELKRERKSLP